MTCTLILRGYSSPIHQHGGCAGSVRVVHGKLACKLYDSVLSEKPMTFRKGDCQLDSLDAQPQEVLMLKAGETTWLNRQSWFVHAVECANDASIEPPDFNFTLSIHFYKSCTDEFAFVADGAHGKAVRKAQPKNDLFWNNDNLEKGHKHYLEHYEDDKGEKILVPDFEKEASLGRVCCCQTISFCEGLLWGIDLNGLIKLNDLRLPQKGFGCDSGSKMGEMLGVDV
eukprot:s1733_g14.t1